MSRCILAPEIVSFREDVKRVHIVCLYYSLVPSIVLSTSTFLSQIAILLTCLKLVARNCHLKSYVKWTVTNVGHCGLELHSEMSN